MSAIDTATQQAAAWFARLRADDVSGADRTAFDSWLREDFEHRAAFERFERFWSTTGGYAGERAVAQTVKNLQVPRRPLIWAAAAGIAVVAIGALFSARLLDSNGVQETRIGEQHALTLEDGSRITLNTDTRLRVDYSNERRRIQLDRGQAYFRVVKDLSRPFEVATSNGIVRALGTEFEVYNQGTQVLVTLVEGKVSVSEFASDGSVGEARDAKVLRPGEIMALQRDAPAVIRTASLEHSTAWLAGKLVFDDEPLEYAVAEANRYSRQQITLGDERLKTLRISGVYRTGEPDEFVRAISSYFALRANREPGGGYVLLPSDTGPN